jgi:predicted acylesterase/phospholipase RssA
MAIEGGGRIVSAQAVDVKVQALGRRRERGDVRKWGMARAEEPWGIGVSMSGGGHRATMAGLGVMLALVDGGLHHDVRWVASVSGGSLANAFVSTRCAFRDVDPVTFDAIVREGITLVERGSLVGTRASKMRAGALGVAVAGCGFGAARNAIRACTNGRAGRLGAFSKAAAFLAPTVLLVRSRGLLVERCIEEIWCSDPAGRAVTLVGPDLPEWFGDTHEDREALRAARDTPTEHVFAATDLLRGDPLYVTPALVVSDRRALPLKRMRLARAVRASASFPAALPPVRLRVDQHTRRPPSFGVPSRVLAIDGGVFNNLASDWHDPRQRGDSDWVFTHPALSVPVSTHIVADAGATLRPSPRLFHEVPVLGFLYGLWRTAMVAYEAGLRGRREALLTTGQSARGPARALLVTVPGYPVSARQWVPDSIGLSKDFWRGIYRSAGSVRTTLRRLSRAQALALIAIGYLNTVSALVNAGNDRDRFGGSWERWLLDDVLAAVPGTTEALEHHRGIWAEIRGRSSE